MRLDEVRIDIRADAHAVRRAGAEVGEHHVAAGGHALDRFPAARLARVHAEGALVEVQIVEVVAPDGPRDVAARRLQLDDIGAEIAEQAPGRRPGDEVRDLQHANAGERRGVSRPARRRCSVRRQRREVGQRPGGGGARFRVCRRLGEADRRPHLHGVAKCRVLEREHHGIVPDLRIVEDDRTLPDRRERHIGRLEIGGPVGGIARLHRPCDCGAEFLLFRHPVAPAHIVEPGLGDEFADAHDPGGAVDEALMHAAELDIFAVRTFVEAVEGRAAGGMGLEHERRDALGDHLRVEEQRAGEQRGLDDAAPARGLAREQACGRADAGEQRRPGARQRMRHMHRRGPEAGHAGENACARHHQVVYRRVVPPPALHAVGGNRAGDEARIRGLQLRRLDDRLLRRGGREVLQQHVHARQQARQRLFGAGGLRIPVEGLLAAIPDGEAAIAMQWGRRMDGAKHPRTRIAQQHPGKGAGGTGSEVEDGNAVERKRHRGARLSLSLRMAGQISGVSPAAASRFRHRAPAPPFRRPCGRAPAAAPRPRGKTECGD